MDRGYLYGLRLSPSSCDAQDLIIGAGVAASDSDTPVPLVNPTAACRSLDVLWSSGGLLDAGVIAANTSYSTFLIGKTGEEDVSFLASTSPHHPVMPDGWDQKRYIGSVRTGGVATIIPFLQTGNWFSWVNYATSASLVAVSVDALALPMFVPTGRKFLVENFVQVVGSSAGFLSVCDPDHGKATVHDAVMAYQTTECRSIVTDWTDTLGRHSFRASTPATINNIFTRRWFDDRGQTVGAI